MLVFSELAGENRRLASQFLYLLFVFGGLSYRLRYRFFKRSCSGTVNLRLCLHSLEKRCEKLRIRLFSCQLYEQVAALILQFFELFLKRSTLTVYLVFLEGKKRRFRIKFILSLCYPADITSVSAHALVESLHLGFYHIER